MKKQLLLSLFLILSYFPIAAQGIFDPSIHTAIGFGDVNSPFAESPQEIIDQNPNTKFLDFFAIDGMGFEVDMLGVMSTVNTIQIVTANDAPERDPRAYEIFGSTDGTTFTSIATGQIPCVAERFLSRFFGFTNTTAYSFYRVNFTGTCALSDIIQVADVQLYPTILNAPIVMCPADIEVGNTEGACGAVVTFAVSATDVEDGMVTPTLISGLPAGSTFPIGTSSVVYTAVDSDNNFVSCNFNVTVADTESPILDCPSDMTVGVANLGDTSIVVDYDFSITDNCSAINPLIDFTSLGTINGKSYYLSDSTFTPEEAFADAVLQGGVVGTIQSAADNQYLLEAILRNNGGLGDVLIGLNDLLIESLFVWGEDMDAVYFNWNMGEPNNAGAFGTSENYTIILTSGLWNDVDSLGIRRYLLETDYVPNQTQGLSSGSAFPIGTTTNTFVISDAAGNMTTCEFNIMVGDVVSTFDQAFSNAISIAPNPTQDILILQNESNLLLENIVLYDLQGKIIRTIQVDSSDLSFAIDVSDLTSGMYLIQVKGVKGVATKKVVKW